MPQEERARPAAAVGGDVSAAGAAAPDAAARSLLAALGAAGDADDAAAVLAAVASARFLGRVGGERHLARLLGNAAYAPLVGHLGARVDPPRVAGAAARVAFTVRGPEGGAAPYLLSMVRERSAGEEPTVGDAEASGAGGWRVTGLVRRELEHL